MTVPICITGPCVGELPHCEGVGTAQIDPYLEEMYGDKEWTILCGPCYDQYVLSV